MFRKVLKWLYWGGTRTNGTTSTGSGLPSSWPLLALQVAPNNYSAALINLGLWTLNTRNTVRDAWALMASPLFL